MKIIKQKKDNPGRSVSSFSSRGSAGIPGFTDNRPVAQAQAKTIQVIQRVGGETVGYEGEDSDLIALLQKGREVNKIKKRVGTEANKKVLDQYADNGAFTQKIQALEVRISTLEGEIDTVKKDIEKISEEIRELEKKIEKSKESEDDEFLGFSFEDDIGDMEEKPNELVPEKPDEPVPEKPDEPDESVPEIKVEMKTEPNEIEAKKKEREQLKKNLKVKTEELKNIQTKLKKKKQTDFFANYKKRMSTDQVKNVYAPYLNNISLSKPFLKEIAPVASSDVITKIKTDEISWEQQIEAEKKNKKLFTKAFGEFCDQETAPETSSCQVIEIGGEKLDSIDTGVAAFKSVSLLEKEKTRIEGLGKKGELPQVYIKKGKKAKSGEMETHYIKDDLGNFVRRYAYMEKNFWQLMNFMETGILSGETQAIKKMDPLQSDVRVIDPGNFDNESLEEDEDLLVKTMGRKADSEVELGRKIAIAYLHQWKGSGKRQRGVSLTSTPKDNAVFGNAGESFRDPEFSAKFKIDLLIARTKNSLDTEEPTNLLISHYAPTSPTLGDRFLKTDSGTFAEPKKEDYPSDSVPSPLPNYHEPYKYRASVIKNRELYLQYVDKASVVEITIHEGSKEKKYEAAEIDKIKDEPYCKSYMAGKNATTKPTGSEWSPDHYDKGVSFQTNLSEGKAQGKADFQSCGASDADAIFRYVFKKMSSDKPLPYWQGFACGLFEAWQEDVN